MSKKAKIALIAILPLMLVGWTLTHRSLVLVDVDAADGPHLVIPMPLILAEGAVHFVPDEVKFVEAPEVAEYLPDAERIVEALRRAGDGVYVEVLERDEYVHVSKDGDELRVRVREGNETRVDVNVSFGSILHALRAYDAEKGGFETSDLVQTLRSMPRGEIVHVLDGADEVTIRMW